MVERVANQAVAAGKLGVKTSFIGSIGLMNLARN